MKILSNTNTNKDITAKNQIISEAANGIPPLVVSSATLVSNLNADLLDGKNASAFATVSHAHGNVSDDGKIGTAANKVITTGTGGTLQASDKLNEGQIDWTTVTADNIPNLPAGKITSGTFSTARIPTLAPSKITQDANNRFVTDTEKSTWNAKQDKLTLNSGQVLGRTSTGSGSPEAVDTINISQIKVSDLDESSLYALKDEIPTDLSELTNTPGFTNNIGTVTQVKLGSTSYNPVSGVISLPADPAAHSTDLLTSGTLGVARGGTGRTDGYAVGVVETRASVLTKIWTGTQAQYDAIGTPDSATLYFITD